MENKGNKHQERVSETKTNIFKNLKNDGIKSPENALL